MAIKHNPDGTCQVFVYDPAKGRKVYIKPRDFGVEPPLKERAARDLERRAILHYKRGGKALDEPVTIREYAEEWLEHHHGEGTKRPSLTTYQGNKRNLRTFLEEFGDRPIDGGIKRKEALRWSKKNGYKAWVVSAMFNDAFDEEETTANPFANRRQEQPRGRRDISPLTEVEVERLGEIAKAVHGEYGKVASAWILFAAWVGSRPGETFSVKWADLDFKEGLVTVTRVKGRKQTEEIVFPKRVQDAVREMPMRHPEWLFTSLRGKPMHKGNLAWYWPRVRDVFMAELEEARRLELLAGRDNFDFYELRHHAASQIVANGGDEYDCAFQLGNTPEECRRTYIHDYRQRRLDTIRQALDGAVVRSLEAHRGGRVG